MVENAEGTDSNFRIAHGSLHDIIVRLSFPLSELGLLAFPNLLLDLFRVCIGFVVLSGFLHGFDGLDIVPHREQDL